MSEADEFFNALFFGNGSWLGLILIVLLMMVLIYRWKEVGVLMIPVSVLLGIEYLSNNLGWHAMIMFLNGVFMIIYLIRKL